MKLLTARPFFLFTVLLSTEDSSHYGGKNGKRKSKLCKTCFPIKK